MIYRWLLLAALSASFAHATPSLVEQTSDDVRIVRDDSGQWGGASAGMTHQNNPRYQAKKILDLTSVPEAAWAAAREVRLSAFFCVRDFSLSSLGKANGLDEAFEVVVNGKVHTFPNNGGAPVYADGKPMAMAWFDFALPKEEFVRVRNEIILRKAATTKAKPDDYLYLGIDNSTPRGNSLLSLDGGKTWSDKQLNTIGARGEYMVRLVLLGGERKFESAWRPATTPALSDPAGVVLYAGTHDGEARLEWERSRLDLSQPVTAVVETASATKFKLRWLDADGKPLPPISGAGPRFETTLKGKPTSGVAVDTAVQSLAVRGVRGYHAAEAPINICPSIAQPAGKPAKRKPSCRVEKDSVLLENATLRCRFAASGKLKLASIFNEPANAETVRQPDKLDLFLVEIGTNRFSGARDFECRSLRAEGRNGFVAELFLPAHSLAATLTGSIGDDGLRLGLSLANRGTAPLDFKVAFPHLAGLALSSDPASDYYFFPRGGGIIADRPALVRQGYGDHQALYQVMDLFSPSLGAGLSLRADDAQGRYKIFALNKHLPGRLPFQTLTPLCPTKPEFQFSNTFEQVTGTSLAVEYLRRTCGPGGTFAPAPVVITAHAGDWKTPMKDYAAWAHRTWKFRPYPSRLDNVATMIAVGWGRDLLFKDGKYRSDFLKPGRDCLELMSWWEWSPLGPWNTPFDKLKERIGEASYTRWLPYFVKDPVTGQTMWNNQPGDYDGYNARFGGLPAFRKAVEDYKKSGSLITLYTDPFRLDESCKTGREHGKEWGVILPNGELSKGYEVWNPCHDLPEVRQWAADAMGRVMRETGADGIRLDEYGHRGWACYSPAHKHTFAEPGCTEWQRATAEATRIIRAAMDKVSRRSVLTTEHPGYDYLMQYLEGCITYDLTVQATSLRPLECNTQRFYFPECKAYELDHRGADRDCHKRLWNMVASFGREFPPPIYAIFKEHADVLRSRDCEPLVPTLMPLVYANRFGSGKKTLWTLYNATGHTVDGPVLEVDVAKGQRLVELLSGVELAKGGTGKQRISLYLPRGGVACVARLNSKTRGASAPSR
jgi:hypothetical protein